MKIISIFLQFLLFWRRNTLKEYLGVLCFDQKIFILTRVTKGVHSNLFFYGTKKGQNFIRFPKKVFIYKANGTEEDLSKASDFKFSEVNGESIVIYNNLDIRGKKCRVIAKSKDRFNWKVVSRTNADVSVSTIVSKFTHDKKYVMLSGENQIGVSESKNLQKWEILNDNIISPRDGFKFDGSRFFDSSKENSLSVISALSLDRGIYVFYNAASKEDPEKIKVGFALLAHDNPGHVLQRGEMPFWEQNLSKTNSKIKTNRPLGICVKRKKIYVYWVKDGELSSVILPDPYEYMDKPVRGALKLKKSVQNPLVEPKSENHWEAVATFNPTATYVNDKVHLLYRAMGHSGLSFMGYAGSENGIDFYERSPEPAYHPREPFEGVNTSPSCYADLYMSGGGWGGCEDARMTLIGDYVYVTYVAYNGYHAPRIAMSHIELEDFLNQNWKKWSKPQLLSKADYVTKGPCLFPEKVNGKYVICHRIFPDILIDYVDDLNFESDEKWLEGHERIQINNPRWDSRKIGVGGAPIKTEKGWLLIYYGVDDRDPARYMIGAMMLDLDNPHKVIARTRKPIVMPEEWYENSGHKSGVAYPCGYVIKNGMLYVYYGGADTVTCVATAPADDFIKALLKEKVEPFELKKTVMI